MDFSAISQVLGSVPAVIWSAIIASAITLSGVMLSNWGNTQRLRVQLAHDSSEKAKERISVLRREVYLEAVEEIVKANNHLASLPQLDPTKQNIADGLQGFFRSSAKLQLVCDLRTSGLVSELMTAYGELLLKMLGYLSPIHDKQLEISISESTYNSAHAELRRILDEMTLLIQQGRGTDPRFEHLGTELASNEARMNKAGAERIAGWEDRNELHKAFVRHLLAEMRVIGQRQVPVMVAIRRELGLDGDEAAFQRQLESNWKRIEVGLDAALAKMT